MDFHIGSHPIRDEGPAFVIAELAWAHDGSVEKAVKIGRGASEAGANAFSIHLTSMPSYMVRNYRNPSAASGGKKATALYDYLESINLPSPATRELVAAVRGTSMALCVMPDDFPSLEFGESLRPDAYVLSAACFVEEDFIQAMGRLGRPIILRVGGATLGEIERAVCLLRESGSAKLLLLHGFQRYPTKLGETNLRFLPLLRQAFRCHVGLADHLDGGDDLALVIPSIALALGAVAIEKHITWDRAERGEDFESALDPQAFATFVRYVRAAEAALGGAGVPPFTEDVLTYRQVSRKRVIAAEDMPAGTILEGRHLVCKRSDEGALPNERAYLIGRRTRVALAKDAPLTFAALE